MSENAMIKAAFVTIHDDHPWRRQIPGGQNCFEGVEFFVPPEDADILFAFNALHLGHGIDLNQQIPKVHIVTEPPDMKRYCPAFLSQFDYVLTPTRETQHPHLILGQTALNWFAGLVIGGNERADRPPLHTNLSFDDFETHHPQKTKLVSVVTSSKTDLPSHRARLEFVARLKDALGDQVDVFGRDINGFVDKRDVLDDYRYHIAIENSVTEHYWTEKLADPYLTLTFPIYHGCPNITDYFHHDAIRTINIYEPDQAIATIKDIIASDLAEKNRDALLEARRQVLYDYNIFAVMARTAKDILAQNRPVVEIKELRAEEHFQSHSWKVKNHFVRLRLLLYHWLERYPKTGALRTVLRFVRNRIFRNPPLEYLKQPRNKKHD